LSTLEFIPLFAGEPSSANGDFNYIIIKKYRKRADADVGLMFVAYNLKRIINILGANALKKYLKDVLSLLCVCHIAFLKASFKQF